VGCWGAQKAAAGCPAWNGHKVSLHHRNDFLFSMFPEVITSINVNLLQHHLQ
jgi:hypothetical protein